MDKQLRIIAGVIVTASKLNKESKLQLLNFIQKEATDIQIKALLLDGKILTKIDEQTKEIIEDRFKVSEVSSYSSFGQVIIKLSQGEANIAGIAAAAAIVYAAVKLQMKIATSKECKNYKFGSPQWKVCEQKVRIMKNKKQVDFIKSKINLCNNSKDPNKCKGKLQEKIKKLEFEIKQRQTKIKDLQKSYSI